MTLQSRYRTQLAIGVMALFLASTALSQEISHRVTFPEGDAAWTLWLKRTPSRAEGQTTPEPREIVRIEAVRAKGVRRDLVYWSDGSTTEFWWPDNLPVALFQNKAGEEIRSIKLSVLGPRRFDESTFSWVSAQAYLGPSSFQGKSALRYRREISIERDKSYEEAIIDAQTGLPLVWSDGLTTCYFAFNPPPAALPVMPADFREAAKRYYAYFTAPTRRMKR